MLIEIYPTGPIETNAIFVGCPKTKRAAIVDPGLNSLSFFQKKEKKHHFEYDKILLTHSHWDHFADLPKVKKEWDIPILIHEKDAYNIENPGSDGLQPFIKIAKTLPDVLLKDGDIVEIGTLQFKVIHTPGHSPGGVCYYCEKEKILLSGDTLFHQSFGKVTLPTSEKNLMIQSIKKLSQLPEDTRVIPGHGPETTIGAESWMKEIEKILA